MAQMGGASNPESLDVLEAPLAGKATIASNHHGSRAVQVGMCAISGATQNAPRHEPAPDWPTRERDYCVAILSEPDEPNGYSTAALTTIGALAPMDLCLSLPSVACRSCCSSSTVQL